MSFKKTAAGFTITSIAISLLLAVGTISLVAFSDSSSELTTSAYVVSIILFFLKDIIFVVPVILLLGVPGYLIYRKLGLNSFKSYMIGGAILGSLVPFLLVLSPSVDMLGIAGFSYRAFLFSSFVGVLAATIFWVIAIKNRLKG